MIIGVPRESQTHETRVALLPNEVQKLVKLGLRIQVAQNLGESLYLSDADYEAAGATVLADPVKLVSSSDIVLRLNVPTLEEMQHVASRALHISFMDPFDNGKLIQLCLEKHISALSMELIPRITRAQAMDALTSQASLAGYVAVTLAAARLPRVFPMMTTPSGTIQPARVFVVGAGVAGLQAIATAKRLGARVEAYDLRPEAAEQIQSLGARAIKIDMSAVQETRDGYVKTVSETQLKQQRAALLQVCAHSDVVITTAQVFGKTAPLIITDEMIQAMQAGSVIVDLAVDSGGNVEGVQPNQVIVKHGVHIVGHCNLPGLVPRDASQMYSANLFYLLKEFWDSEKKDLVFDRANPILEGALVTHHGEICHPHVHDIWEGRLD